MEFQVPIKNGYKSYIIRTREIDNDSLKNIFNLSGVNFNDQFEILSNNPLIEIDSNKFSLIDKDSVDIDFEIIEDNFNSNLKIALKLDQSQRYNLRLLPGALIDFFGEQMIR